MLSFKSNGSAVGLHLTVNLISQHYIEEIQFQTDWRWLRQFYYETVLRDLEAKVWVAFAF